MAAKEKKAAKDKKAAKEKKAKSAPKKFKGKIPSKQTLNLLYKEKDTGRRVFVLVVVILFFMALIGFAWFVVRVQLSRVAKARNKYESLQSQFNELKEVEKQYENIEELYSHYGSSYLNAEELALQDRIDVLKVINDEISLAQGLSQIQLSGNTATVQLMSLELKEVSSIVAQLEESPIVSYVGVNTAAMDEHGSLVRKNGSLVQATLTIDFHSATGQVLETEGGLGETANQLAARKAAVESLGEE